MHFCSCNQFSEGPSSDLNLQLIRDFRFLVLDIRLEHCLNFLPLKLCFLLEVEELSNLKLDRLFCHNLVRFRVRQSINVFRKWRAADLSFIVKGALELTASL